MINKDSGTSRIAFLIRTLGMSEKMILDKMVSEDYDGNQSEMLEYLQNNNSFYHNENKKIINTKKIKFSKTEYCELCADKTINDFIYQFNKFPLVNINTTLSSCSGSTTAKSTTIKMYRSMIINYYQSNIKVNIKHSRGNSISCFSCFGHRKKVSKCSTVLNNPLSLLQKNAVKMQNVSFNDNKNYSLPQEGKLFEKNEKKQSKGKGERGDSEKIYLTTAAVTSNKTLPGINNLKAGQTLSSSDVMKKNYLKLEKLSDKIQRKSQCMKLPPNLKESSCKLKTEKIEYPFSFNCKSFTFLLTNDLAKAINFISKTSNSEFIVHSFSYSLGKKAFKNDLYFYEYDLRTNFKQLIKSKNINFPILLNGNVYFPNLVLFRGNEQMGYKLLKYPLSFPMLIAQMVPLHFSDENTVEKINKKIIEENIQISEHLNYDTLIINMLPIGDSFQIFSLIKCYIEGIKINIDYGIKNICFLLNANEEQFQMYIASNDIPLLLENENFRAKIICI